MQVKPNNPIIAHNHDNDTLEEIIAQTVNPITVEMVKALMNGRQEGLDFKGLAEKHISATQNEDVAALNQQAQAVYKKLFLSTHEHIQAHSPPLVMTFALMNDQTHNPESAGLFLGSFVLPAAKSIVERIAAQPAAAL